MIGTGDKLLGLPFIWKYGFLLTICICLCMGLHAERYPDGPESSRSFEKEDLSEVLADEQYNYGKEPLSDKRKRKNGDSADRWNKNQSGWGNRKEAGEKWKFLMYSCAAIILILLIVFILRQTLGRSGNSISSNRGIPELNTDIRVLDFEDLLHEAIQQGDYRRAVRLLYLESLKVLTQNGWINWEPNKTNQDYRRELSNTHLSKKFDIITHNFNYIWYGDFPIDAAAYKAIAPLFHDFQSLIKPKHEK